MDIAVGRISPYVPPLILSDQKHLPETMTQRPSPTQSPPPSCSSSHTSTTSNDISDYQVTREGVDWDALADVALQALRVDPAIANPRWGEEKCGGFNLVRFLHVNSAPENLIVVARVPIRQKEELGHAASAKSNRIRSEVATMEYVARHTTIPVPRVLAFSAEASGNARGDRIGSPYILMTKVDGVLLVDIWDDMVDSKREGILKQVVDILLQLSDLRFDAIGALMKNDSDDSFYLVPPLSIDSEASESESQSLHDAGLDVLHTSTLEYWTRFATAVMQRVGEQSFGSSSKKYGYCISWVHRALLPSVIDPSLDATGFPLSHGDFHSQNIIVVDADSDSPKISGIIDWENTTTDGTSIFAQHPLFIVDHPLWEDDHPLKKRNIRDQRLFDRLVKEAEDSEGTPPTHVKIAKAFAFCWGVYYLTQCLQFPSWGLQDELDRHFFGADEKGETLGFPVEHYTALMKGILREDAERFDREEEVLLEAKSILGDEVPFPVDRKTLRVLLAQKEEQFPTDTLVRRWLRETTE